VPREGDPAPRFTLPDQDGRPVSLDDLTGRWVLLWWYPGAGTPGCTVEGQMLRDASDEYAAAGAEIVGISFDPPEVNRAWREAQEFPFTLLSDVDRSVGAEYGVRRADADRFAAFARRYSFLIDPQGVIRRIYTVSDVGDHATEVLSDVRQLATA
jgi:peroxiredoxin Q/BCP